MKAIGKISTGAAIIAVSIIIVYVFYGGFDSIQFSETVSGGETVMFDTTIGDYPATEKTAIKISNFLKQKGKDNFIHYSYFSINPHLIDKKYLKSEGGCIINSIDTASVKLFKHLYPIKIISPEKSVITHFPLKGRLSIVIAHVKVYPRLLRYMKMKKYDCMAPVTEIMDYRTKVITFRMKISPKKTGECE